MATASMASSLPRQVWVLGTVSLLMDMSSELIHALLPIMLTTLLGANMMTIGVLEGLAEALAQIVKVFSGALSDYLGRRRGLILLGYGLAALSKPLFPLAHSVALVFVARLLDRLGKGIRGAPRDALVADVTPEALRGTAYGLRQTMDTVGAFLGPLCATFFLFLFRGDLRSVLWIGSVPALACFFVIIFFLREPQTRRVARSPRLDFHQVRALGRGFWTILLVAGLAALARFGDAFLLLRAYGLGVPQPFLPMILIVMNILYAASAYPAGLIADRLSRRMLLAVGMVLLLGASLLLGMANGFVLLGIGVGLWGLHLGLTQGLLNAMVSWVAPRSLVATGLGLLNLATGMASLASGLLAGFLWDRLGAGTAYEFAAAIALLALAAVPMLPRIARHS
ncbi:MAG TPA: MFS transporter [Dongiaceae bacterium]|jgi:MFS family permease|nr:MFS transporter [Dongiaceae bacterium]